MPQSPKIWDINRVICLEDTCKLDNRLFSSQFMQKARLRSKGLGLTGV